MIVKVCQSCFLPLVVPEKEVFLDKHFTLKTNINVKPRGKPFAAGNTGRPKGAQGKLNRTVKETVLAVFNEIQEDPKVKLLQFAKTYPRDFYAIAAKLIPTEISGEIDQTIKLHIVRGKPGSEPTT